MENLFNSAFNGMQFSNTKTISISNKIILNEIDNCMKTKDTANLRIILKNCIIEDFSAFIVVYKKFLTRQLIDMANIYIRVFLEYYKNIYSRSGESLKQCIRKRIKTILSNSIKGKDYESFKCTLSFALKNNCYSTVKINDITTAHIVLEVFEKENKKLTPAILDKLIDIEDNRELLFKLLELGYFNNRTQVQVDKALLRSIQNVDSTLFELLTQCTTKISETLDDTDFDLAITLFFRKICDLQSLIADNIANYLAENYPEKTLKEYQQRLLYVPISIELYDSFAKINPLYKINKDFFMQNKNLIKNKTLVTRELFNIDITTDSDDSILKKFKREIKSKPFRKTELRGLIELIPKKIDESKKIELYSQILSISNQEKKIFILLALRHSCSRNSELSIATITPITLKKIFTSELLKNTEIDFETLRCFVTDNENFCNIESLITISELSDLKLSELLQLYNSSLGPQSVHKLFSEYIQKNLNYTKFRF